MHFGISDDDVYISKRMIELILRSSYQELLLPLYVVRCTFPSLSLIELQAKLRWDNFKLNKMINHLNSLSVQEIEDLDYDTQWSAL